MKNKFYIVFFTLILAGFTAFGQSGQLIKQFDTLQNGSVLIRLMLQDSTYLKQYFAISPVDTSLLFNNILTSLPQSDQSNTDYQIENDNLLGQNTSAIPWDICFNPVQNKFYIYNYRKIMIRNNGGAGYFDTPVTISDFDEINENMLEITPSKKMLYYNNYVYCTSNEGKLVIINTTNNQIVMEYPSTQMSSLYNSDLRLVGSNVYWYYCAISDIGSLCTTIRKVSGTNLSASLNLTQIIVNDWCFDEYNNMYLATNNGLFKYSSDLSLLNSTLQNQNITNVEYFNNGTIKRLIAKKISFPSNERLQVYTTTLLFDHEFEVSLKSYFNMIFEETSDIIHFTGISTSDRGYYGRIFYDASSGEFMEDNSHLFIDTPPLALAVDGTDAWISDKDKITRIDQNFVITDYPVDGYFTNLNINDNSTSFYLFGTVPMSGDFVVFDNSMVSTAFETGGIINGVCNKLDKTYYSVTKNNGKGYVVCKKNSSVTKIAPGSGYFDPLAIFCFKEDEHTDVIVAFEGRNSFDERRLKFAKIDFNTLNLSILEGLDFHFDGNITDLVIKQFEERIYFTEVFPNTCGSVPLVYFHFTPFGTLCFNSTEIYSCPDLVYDPVSDRLYTLDKCNKKLYTYNADDLTIINFEDLVKEAYYHPISLCFNSTGNRLLISGRDEQNDNNIRLLECNPSHDPFVLNTYPLNSSGITVTDLTLSKDNNVYGFSEVYCYKINPTFNMTQITLPEVLESYTVDFDFHKNLFYIQSLNNTANDVETFILDASTNTFLSPVVSGNKYLINTVEEHNLSYYNSDRAIIFTANHHFVSSSKITCPFTRPLLTPWHWLSFPRLQRTGNNPVTAIPILENTEPMPYNLSFNSNEGGQLKYIARANNVWTIEQFENILSTKGYKLSILDQGAFTHTMYGTDVNPNTPVPLYVSQNGNPENWIGYFLPIALEPEDAFVGVWDCLTEIKTQYWTMIKTSTGKWIRPQNVTPLEFGDAVIVKVSQNCTLYWNMAAEPAEEQEEGAKTEYFSYVEYSDYIPWYIEIDSLQSIQEIALLSGDSCVGASVVLPGDTLVEVNAYSQAVPPGTTVEIATWDGLKSTARNTRDFLISNIRTGARESRKVFTGEGLPYYLITFGNAKNSEGQTSAVSVRFLNISPNPCTGYTNIGFAVERDAMVEIRITGINGKPLTGLVNGYYPEGAYQSVWQHGNEVGNGIYLVQLIVNGSLIHHEKLVVIR